MTYDNMIDGVIASNKTTAVFLSGEPDVPGEYADKTENVY